jgi:uncharacterized protein (TIGR03083 family)
MTAVLERLVARTAEVVDALRRADLDAPSLLPGWGRLTIACHLRYGAETSHRMTAATLAGEATAFYPGGRDRQRPATLVPRPGERSGDVVASLAEAGDRLHRLWAGLGPDGWARTVVEPTDRPDLGPLPLRGLALLRLTEVEVHGTDLGLGLPGWSDEFVRAALPFRVDRLHRRRPAGGPLHASWLVVATDGPSWLVSVDGDRVDTRPAPPGTQATERIEGTSRDLVALLLGRGDPAFGESFRATFPGP